MRSPRAMTKSPVALAQEALALAQQALDPYSCANSRHDFTQPQLFAIAVLRQFFRTDYRGVVQLLKDFSDLRQVLGLKKVPHFTTVQKAENRLEKRGFGDRSLTLFSRAQPGRA